MGKVFLNDSASASSPAAQAEQHRELRGDSIPTDANLVEAARRQLLDIGPHSARREQTHSPDVHARLRAARLEGPVNQVQGATSALPTSAGTSTGTLSQSERDFHSQFLEIFSGTKRRSAVTNDAELAEFVRQHPELSQYIQQLQEARDEALSSAQESQQSAFQSRDNLLAKLDVIATLLEGSPLAPQLRMGDQGTYDKLVTLAEVVLENAEEAEAVTSYVWERAQVRILANERAHVQELDAGRSAIEQQVDPANPEAVAQASSLAIQLYSQARESSAQLPSADVIDSFLALNPEQRKVVDDYFITQSNTPAEQFLLETYLGIRTYERPEGSTALVRAPIENREAIVARLTLSLAAQHGIGYEFRDGQVVNDNLFRRTMAAVFGADMTTSQGIRSFAEPLGGIDGMDYIDHHVRMYAAEQQLRAIAIPNSNLSAAASAEQRAALLSGVLGTVVSTDEETGVNLASQLVQTIESLPAAERRQLAIAYRALTGMSIEQGIRERASPAVAEPVINAVSYLLATSGNEARAALSREAVANALMALQAALRAQTHTTPDAQSLVASAGAMHSYLEQQGISVGRALDPSTEEGRALDDLLRDQLTNEFWVTQARAAIFAVELERQASPFARTLPSQGMIGCYLGLAPADRGVVQQYFREITGNSVERHLIEAFSGAHYYQSRTGQPDSQREQRNDARQIVAALILSTARETGAPIQLREGQIQDPVAAANAVRRMYPANERSAAERTLQALFANVGSSAQLLSACRQGLLARSLDVFRSTSYQTDRERAAVVAQNLSNYLAPDPTGGGTLALPWLSLISELPQERRDALRVEYRALTGREILSDIRTAMDGQDQAQVDLVIGSAAIVLGSTDFERGAGVLAQSLAREGSLTPAVFAVLMRALDGEGNLARNPEALQRLDGTIAAYEQMSGENFNALLERNGIRPAIVEGLRNGDRLIVDAFNIRAIALGSESPIQDVHQLLGGEFNLNSRPDLAAAYERSFGEPLGDIRESVVRAGIEEYRADVESRRRAIDTLSSRTTADIENLDSRDITARDVAMLALPVYGVYEFGTKFFYIWDGAYGAESSDIRRRSEENLALTEVYAERATRLDEVTRLTNQASALLQQSAERLAAGDTQQAALFDRQASELFATVQCRMLDVAHPTKTLEAMTERAQQLAREHAELQRAGASSEQLNRMHVEARAAFDDLVRGAWGPHQTAIVREAIRSVLEIDSSLDPRGDSRADAMVRQLLSNERGTGYLDSVPEDVLSLSTEDREHLNQENAAQGNREIREGELLQQRLAEFSIEAEFHRNSLRPTGRRNLALLDLEQRYIHRRNLADFQAEWNQVMANFDRTEGQLKAARTVVLVAGSLATGGAGLPYLLAVTGGSHALQGAVDVAVGNKTWGEAGRAVVYEGGKDLLNVGMAGGMAMRSGQVAGLMSRMAGTLPNAARATTFVGRAGQVGRQLSVSGGSGAVLGFGMEGANLGWDAANFHLGSSQHEVTWTEVSNRLLTAGSTGFIGGMAGGGSAMLRGAMSGPGAWSLVGRNGAAFSEYALAGSAAQFQVGWSPNGTFGVAHQGFDAFAAVSAIGSTYAGNRAAVTQVHQPSGPRVQSFTLFQPEPGVFSTPQVRNFSAHSAELQPVVNFAQRILGSRSSLDTTPVSLQAAHLSHQIAIRETSLSQGFEMIEVPRAMQDSGVIVPTDAEVSASSQRVDLTPERRLEIEFELAALRGEFNAGRARARVDQRDSRAEARAGRRINDLSREEISTLREARSERIEIEAQLGRRGTDAVQGVARAELENRLRVLREVIIPRENAANRLYRQYQPETIRDSAQRRLMERAIREVAELEGFARNDPAYANLSDAQYRQLLEGYRVIEECVYARRAGAQLEATLEALQQRQQSRGWSGERLSAERRVAILETDLRNARRLGVSSADRDLNIRMIEEQLCAARRERSLERQVERLVRLRGHGTENEHAAARAYLLARRNLAGATETHSAELKVQYEAAYQAHRDARRNARAEARYHNVTARIDSSDVHSDLRAALREQAELRRIFDSCGNEAEFVARASRSGNVAARQTLEQRMTADTARRLLTERARTLREQEIPLLRRASELAEGRRYEGYPEVYNAARRLASLEARWGGPITADAVVGEGTLRGSAAHPELVAAEIELRQARRNARVDMNLTAQLNSLSATAQTRRWHRELRNAQVELIECQAAVRRTAALSSSDEQRQLALGNLDAARARADIELEVHRLAVRNGYATPEEFALARRVARLGRENMQISEVGVYEHPEYRQALADLRSRQVEIRRTLRDEARNRRIDASIERAERRINSCDELPDLRDFRMELLRAERALDRRGAQRPDAAGEAILREQIANLRERLIPQAKRVDQLARRWGYSSQAEIDAARKIAAFEQRTGSLSAEDQAELQGAWRRYQQAQSAEQAAAHASRVDRATAARFAEIDERPWIAERRAAAREEARLEGELRKIRGSSDETQARRRELREELRVYREGPLRDAERLDFLARLRGQETGRELEAARRLIASERTLNQAHSRGEDVSRLTAQREEALNALRFERARVSAENRRLAQARRVEWVRDYSAQEVFDLTLPSKFSPPMYPAASAAARPATELETSPEERVAEFETLFGRRLRSDEVEFLGTVPDSMYKEVIRRIHRNESPAQATLTGGADDLPQLPGSDTTQRWDSQSDEGSFEDGGGSNWWRSGGSPPEYHPTGNGFDRRTGYGRASRGGGVLLEDPFVEFQPLWQRAAWREPSRARVATAERPIFNVDFLQPVAESNLAVLSPEVERHMVVLAQAMDEIMPAARTTALASRSQVSPELMVESPSAALPQAALAAPVGQVIARVQPNRGEPVADPDTSHRAEPLTEAARESRGKPQNPEDTYVPRQTTARRNGEGVGPSWESFDEKRKRGQKEAEHRKYLQLQAKSEKKGGARLIFTHVTDELGEAGLVIETEENA